MTYILFKRRFCPYNLIEKHPIHEGMPAGDSSKAAEKILNTLIDRKILLIGAPALQGVVRFYCLGFQ
jgi:hypothetical protein